MQLRHREEVKKLGKIKSLRKTLRQINKLILEIIILLTLLKYLANMVGL